MRVLVTRPEAAARDTVRRLGALGHEAVSAPLLAIAATGSRLPAGRFDALLATSANALQALARIPKGLLPLPFFAVGERTMAAAAARGFTGPAHGGRDAGALLASLLPTLAPGSRLLYLAAADRKPDLEEGLRAVGHTVDTVETYEARPLAALPAAAREALARGELDAVLHYSARSAAVFCELVSGARLTAQAARLSHHCISPDAALHLASIGADRVVVAERPDDGGVLATLRPSGPSMRRCDHRGR